MKTTVEIADPLFERARQVAREQGVTFRELVEAGLVRILAERTGPTGAFRLRDASLRGGRGLQAEFRDGDWSRILAAAYEGRG